uniref:Uncharacterized protein n=1 Tax=Geobacter sp. (strain M21) TaxID=443144 RepID=C6E0U5_GEOSM
MTPASSLPHAGPSPLPPASPIVRWKTHIRPSPLPLGEGGRRPGEGGATKSSGCPPLSPPLPPREVMDISLQSRLGNARILVRMVWKDSHLKTRCRLRTTMPRGDCVFLCATSTFSVIITRFSLILTAPQCWGDGYKESLKPGYPAGTILGARRAGGHSRPGDAALKRKGNKDLCQKKC